MPSPDRSKRSPSPAFVLCHVRRTQLRSVSAPRARAAKAACPLSSSSFPELGPLRRVSIRIPVRCTGTRASFRMPSSSCRQSVDSLRGKNGNFRKSSHFCTDCTAKGDYRPLSRSPHASPTCSVWVCLQSDAAASRRPCSVLSIGPHSSSKLTTQNYPPAGADLPKSPLCAMISQVFLYSLEVDPSCIVNV